MTFPEKQTYVGLFYIQGLSVRLLNMLLILKLNIRFDVWYLYPLLYPFFLLQSETAYSGPKISNNNRFSHVAKNNITKKSIKKKSHFRLFMQLL